MSITFEQFAYARPKMKALSQKFEQLLLDFHAADNAKIQIGILGKLNKIRSDFSSMYNLCYIRHSVNTKDSFYEAENEYFDKTSPSFEALNNKFYKAILGSPFRSELESKYGAQLFVLAELALRTFEPTILQDMEKENMLSTEYTKLKAQATIEFDGKTYNLSNIYPLELSEDRNLRKRANTAKWAFYEKNAPEIERIFDEMVKTRHRMAQELGYKNFVEMGYARMRRSDYTPEMVANFRKQVQEIIVPIASALYKRQAKRLGIKKLCIYDEDYKFPSGNPKPIGTPEEIVANAAKMYKELSVDTDKFFAYMNDTKLMDLVNRDGKAMGGYCTYITKHKAPYIFSNFNGTSADIDVLTHEAGHAFQVYSSARFPFEEYHWPTSDAAEIHSMSMEFFTYPWMENFFGDQTDKYKFMHLGNALQFIPYGVAVDEFQHIIYEHPDLTPAERNQAWRDIEHKYLPHRHYDGNSYLEQGGFWQKQSHIFNSPFYYIDYTLAQICAFQFWLKDQKNHQIAWRDYVRLCKQGGSMSFLQLVASARLKSPFDDGTVASIAGKIKKWLNNVDDTAF